ncbi:hypothetical protein DFQ28_001887 [Apophysomyces sp. BC1034]|nr:hypothetical protein DFQ30_007529 [Apophysomyces sp. BC1015]KAG0174346.1 hypothetical protein DFQ29_007519 [Apophysomyces sp. BC1021]KAG0190555.1 hypothetical protein DFQ28_001887 [Apophysomyces sp. BC1034]
MNQQNTSSILDSYESTENALIDSFKAAALKVTTLYKDSLVQNRKAYAAGYQQALQDLYGFITSHPSTTISQRNGSVATPVERGFLPVEDLLGFARQRNAQLTSEMGCPSEESLATSQQPATTNSNANTSNIQRLQAGDEFKPAQGAFHPSAGNYQTNTPGMPSGFHGTAASNRSTLLDVPQIPSAAVPTVAPTNPFQIDPNTQFTFTPPSHETPHLQSVYANTANSNAWDNNFHQDNFVDGFKRRLTPSDLTFMGRTMSNMNVDTWYEPPFKRGRARRED